MKRETYAQARLRLMAECYRAGWAAPSLPLKTPWRESIAHGRTFRVWFKPQAVHLGLSHKLGEALSLHRDIRGLSWEDFAAACERAVAFAVRLEQEHPRS